MYLLTIHLRLYDFAYKYKHHNRIVRKYSYFCVHVANLTPPKYPKPKHYRVMTELDTVMYVILGYFITCPLQSFGSKRATIELVWDIVDLIKWLTLTHKEQTIDPEIWEGCGQVWHPGGADIAHLYWRNVR